MKTIFTLISLLFSQLAMSHVGQHTSTEQFLHGHVSFNMLIVLLIAAVVSIGFYMFRRKN